MDLVLVPSIDCLHNNIKLYVLKGFGATHFHIGYEYCYTRTKKKGTPRKHPQVTVWPPWTLLHTLQATNSLLFPWLVTTQGLLCRTTQCNFRSLRWFVRTSCLTTQKLFGMWPQIEHLQCTCTARHHGQTPFDFTNQLLVFISQKALWQHKRPDPCHHLICSITLRSEARTCQ
jgi:hypothetical protein